MKSNPQPGKFIVLEGLDGSGKSTQINLLMDRLVKDDYRVASFDFPQHGERSAALADDYLNGKYGPSREVSPHQAAIFYACDRYDASFKIRAFLKEGTVVVCDRYVASNAAHQGGKIENHRKRKEFFRWLYKLEYGIFNIPQPDISIILKTSPETSLRLADSGGIFDEKKLARRKAYLGDKNKDIHEKDIAHLKAAFDAYLQLAKEFPRSFKVVECIKDGDLLPPEIIHEKIWAEVKKAL